jgi:FixJ family two-component response regulator
MNSTDATVFVVDDDAGVRDSLALLLALRGLKTQMFANGEDVLRSLRPDWRGCLLIDVRMPGMGGLELLQELRRRGCNVPAVIITAHGDVNTARAALKAKAADFLEKPIDEQVLLDVIADAISAAAQDPPATADGGSRPVAAAGLLTMREQQVRELVADGFQVKQIAEKLGISPRTVEVYKARLAQKLRSS